MIFREKDEEFEKSTHCYACGEKFEKQKMKKQ